MRRFPLRWSGERVREGLGRSCPNPEPERGTYAARAESAVAPRPALHARSASDRATGGVTRCRNSTRSRITNCTIQRVPNAATLAASIDQRAHGGVDPRVRGPGRGRGDREGREAEPDEREDPERSDLAAQRPLARLLPDPAAVELERRDGADRGGDHVGPPGRHRVGRHEDAEHGQADAGGDQRHRAVAEPLREPIHDRISVDGWNTQRRSRTKRATVANPLAAVSVSRITGRAVTSSAASPPRAPECEGEWEQRERGGGAVVAGPAGAAAAREREAAIGGGVGERTDGQRDHVGEHRAERREQEREERGEHHRAHDADRREADHLVPEARIDVVVGVGAEGSAARRRRARSAGSCARRRAGRRWRC